MMAKPREQMPADLFDQEHIFFNSGSSESPTPESTEDANVSIVIWVVAVDQKNPSIFLIFKYAKKQDDMLTIIISKVVYSLNTKSYEHLKLKKMKI